MMRSAIASSARPSSALKNCHGPALTGTGGLPAFGTQGRRPSIVSAGVAVAAASNNAVPVSTWRRLTATSGGNFSATLDFPLLLLNKHDHRRHALDGHKDQRRTSERVPAPSHPVN